MTRSKLIRPLISMLTDALIILFVYVVGYLAQDSKIELNALFLILVIICLKLAISYVLKIYKTMLSHFSMDDAILFCSVVLVENIVIYLVIILVDAIPDLNIFVYFLMSVLEMFLQVSSRACVRLYRFYKHRGEKSEPVCIIGAGSAGKIAFDEIRSNPAFKGKVVFFVDADKNKIGKRYLGKPVYGPIEEIHDLFVKHNIKIAVIAISNLDKTRLKEIVKILSKENIQIKRLPLLTEMDDPTKPLRIKDISIEDLLGRDPITLDIETLNEWLNDKKVLITGGGGSIGSELCRQVAKMNPRQIIILDIYENCAYDIQQELKMLYGNKLDLQVEIISITNYSALERVFDRYRPNIVIMAAAHKHVPFMEHNVIEAVENNVFGTLNTVLLAEKYEVDRVHMVSTDKAVNPTSVMGATKRICEMIVQSHSQIKQHTTFSATRFGNVLGSAGSVIPLFKRQIAQGGPVTLTDKRIIRYFMTIPEASQLVLCSAAMAKNGELFVLDMGQPVRIYDLATNMIRMSGLEPDKDIEIKEIGLRPGEKLYEELLVKTEELDKTDNELIFIERDKPLSLDEVDVMLDKLHKGVEHGDDVNMKNIIKEVVPTFIEKEEANKEFVGAR